ncbi:MAG: ferritin-like domain-containing protein [Myxococcales bacterium]|nr:ferritin-like domain-containing protein [Myxococcales bacterium]
MNSSGSLLALARRVVASVAVLSLSACCRELERSDRFVGAAQIFRDASDASIDDASCPEICRRNVFFECVHSELRSCTVAESDGGAGVRCAFTTYECPRSPFEGVCGRRTDGAAIDSKGDVLGGLVALEAEAVAAFERLARELAALGAPETLVAWAQSSADDERRHVEMTRSLDGRAVIEAPPTDALALRSLFDVALENAVEGCVREAFGVVIASWQAEHGADPRVRACYRTIAEDEAKHAALALEIDQWTASRLTARETMLVREAKLRALTVLRDEQSRAREDAWLGLPDARASIAIFDEFARDARWLH